MRAEALWAMSLRELGTVMATGHPVDLEALEDTEYRGVSLGLPTFVDRLLWKTFRKTFHRDPHSGVLRGWNVRMEQHGVAGARVPMRRRGRTVTFGHYRVLPGATSTVYRGWNRGVFLDYGAAGNALLDPGRFMRAPLVAVNEGDPSLLLGWDYVALGPLWLPTPAYWTLEKEGPLSEIVAPPGRLP